MHINIRYRSIYWEIQVGEVRIIKKSHNPYIEMHFIRVKKWKILFINVQVIEVPL